jgi:hypothetical protein
LYHQRKILHIRPRKYYKPFLEEVEIPQNVKLEKALEPAWMNRDYEIDKYWSRATYFWAL